MGWSLRYAQAGGRRWSAHVEQPPAFRSRSYVSVWLPADYLPAPDERGMAGESPGVQIYWLQLPPSGRIHCSARALRRGSAVTRKTPSSDTQTFKGKNWLVGSVLNKSQLIITNRKVTLKANIFRKYDFIWPLAPQPSISLVQKIWKYLTRKELSHIYVLILCNNKNIQIASITHNKPTTQTRPTKLRALKPVLT